MNAKILYQKKSPYLCIAFKTKSIWNLEKYILFQGDYISPFGSSMMAT